MELKEHRTITTQNKDRFTMSAFMDTHLNLLNWHRHIPLLKLEGHLTAPKVEPLKVYS